MNMHRQQLERVMCIYILTGNFNTTYAADCWVVMIFT